MNEQTHTSTSEQHAPDAETSAAVAPSSAHEVAPPPPTPLAPAPVIAAVSSNGTVTAAVPPASSDYMDRAAFKELVQLVGAMLFVALLVATGWHAAHYSGAWPY